MHPVAIKPVSCKLTNSEKIATEDVQTMSTCLMTETDWRVKASIFVLQRKLSHNTPNLTNRTYFRGLPQTLLTHTVETVECNIP